MVPRWDEQRLGQRETAAGPRPRSLGVTLRRIEAATGVRRETASGYLRAAGISVRGRGRPGEGVPKPAITTEVSTDSGPSKPAITGTVSTDPGPPAPPGRAPSASACEPYREVITDRADTSG